MKQYALIGFPLGHSFSKSYFQSKFEREGLADLRYDNIEIENEEALKAFITEANYEGANITIPWKEKALEYLTEISLECKEIGSVNVLKKMPSGHYKGFNTDWIGFKETLRPLLKPWHTSALILGDGGATKAVIFVLEKLEIDYQIVSRNQGNKSGRIAYENLRQIDVRNAPIIINCTPLGMFPNTETYPDIPYSGIDKFHLLIDLVYNPSVTVFLKKGAEKGAMTKNGYDMLVKQAEESWKIWNNH
ncbi:MAG TPA: shikimate dehydrogenase [Bacteroidia bacterium]|jgi:shikimate dehydrogenase|nr:shikimate dehydrogenase [Bacteroidia bacterium]